MLDRYKLLSQLDQADKDLFCNFTNDKSRALSIWDAVKDLQDLSSQIHKKKYSLLVPEWQGALSYRKKIDETIQEYGVLAVDGSQIYYDKHQGPGCYLINIGAIVFNYSIPKSFVQVSSQPYVFFLSHQNREMASSDYINLQREEYEFARAWELSVDQKSENSEKPFLTMIDGSLIFFHLDSQEQEQKQAFLAKYFDYLQKFHDHNRLIVGYISFPRNKDLLNVLRLAAVQFEEPGLLEYELFEDVTDLHIAHFYLEPGYRSGVFKSKAPITYMYPGLLKPYFCYLHVGSEIVRLEFPEWIAQKEELVDQICRLAYDQAAKGRGYPVCLFEAHEQAVIKGHDRDFFYAVLQKKVEKQSIMSYERSLKSLKKLRVDI